MNEHSQRDKTIKDIKKLTRANELQAYLRENVPYEDLLDSEFIAMLSEVNPLIKRVLQGAIIDKGFDQAREYEQEADLETIDGIKSYIKKVDIHVALSQHRDAVLKLARHYEEEGEYEEAQKYYSAIIGHGRNRKESFIRRYGQDDKDTVYHKARIGSLACKSNMGEELTDEEKDELSASLEKVSSQQKSIDAFLTYFSPLPKAQLLRGDFGSAVARGFGTGNSRGVNPNPPVDVRQYSGALFPENRIKHIVDNYEITKAYTGIGEFAGYIVFEIEDKNVFVVEKFYEPMAQGQTEPVPSYGAATYILNKQVEINIQEMTRVSLVAMKKNSRGAIDAANHIGDKYYDRFDEKLEAVSRWTPEKTVQQQEKTEEPQESIPVQDELPVQQTTDETQNVRSVDIIVNEMEELDTNYTNLLATVKRAKEIQQEISQIQQQVEQIKAEVTDAAQGTMTREIASIVKQQVDLLSQLRNKLKELEFIAQSMDVQECEVAIAKNREKRNRLNEELMNIVGE